MSLLQNLLDTIEDEGRDYVINTAQNYCLSLEEMMEIASKEEMKIIYPAYQLANDVLTKLLDQPVVSRL